jgi:hypothetical protein
MTVESERIKAGDGVNQKDEFIIRFNNGALQQLESLKKALSLSDETEVVKMAISLLQSVANRETASKPKAE